MLLRGRFWFFCSRVCCTSCNILEMVQQYYYRQLNCKPWKVANFFVWNFVKNQQILIRFSLSDFKMNDACDSMNLPTFSLNLCCYTTLWKSKNQKCMWTQLQLLMITTKWPLHASNCTDSFKKKCESYKWTCIQSVHHQHAHRISDGHATGQSQRRWCPGQSETKFASSFFAGRWWVVSYMHCWIMP